MIAIIGAGTMGKSIAIEFARFGHKVLLISAQRHLSCEDLNTEVKKVADKFHYENEHEILNNILSTNEYSKISQCNLIIEAVSEDLSIKRKIIKEIKELIHTNSIISSNTSSLSIENIFYGLVPLENVIGLHFFNPVQIMKLVELSYLSQTNIELIEEVKSIILSLEKEIVIVKNSPGFIVNRLLIPMINEAAKIVEEGVASIDDVDKAMKFGANHPIGPLKLADLIGIDITLAILNSLKEKIFIEPSKMIEELVKSNKLGRKTKIGFYKYDIKK